MPNAERALRGDEHWDVCFLARRPDVRHATQTTLIMRRGASRELIALRLATTAVTKRSHAFEFSSRGAISRLAEQANQVTLLRLIMGVSSFTQAPLVGAFFSARDAARRCVAGGSPPDNRSRSGFE